MKKVRAEDGSGDAPAKVNGEPEKSEKKEEEKKEEKKVLKYFCLLYFNKSLKNAKYSDTPYIIHSADYILLLLWSFEISGNILRL